MLVLQLQPSPAHLEWPIMNHLTYNALSSHTILPGCQFRWLGVFNQLAALNFMIWSLLLVMEEFNGAIDMLDSEPEQPLKKQSPATMYAWASAGPVTQKQANTSVWPSCGARTTIAAGPDWQIEPPTCWRSESYDLVSMLAVLEGFKDESLLF